MAMKVLLLATVNVGEYFLHIVAIVYHFLFKKDYVFSHPPLIKYVAYNIHNQDH